MTEPEPDDVAGALTRLEEQVTQLHDEVRRIGGVAALPVPADDHALQPAPGSYAWAGARRCHGSCSRAWSSPLRPPRPRSPSSTRRRSAA